MRDLHHLMTEIVQLTSNIETNYPELYRFLDENPMTIHSGQNPAIDKGILKSYLQTLKLQLKHHIEQHHAV